MNKRQKKKRAMSRLKVRRAVFGKRQATIMRRQIRVGLKTMSNTNAAMYGRAYLIRLIDQVLTLSIVSHSAIDIQEVLSKTDNAFNNELLS